MERKYDRKLVLEDGSEYYGYGFGGNCEKVCELIFNTSMAGYQEIASDPSYTYQMVVMTYPLIGNYGIADDDFESKTPTIGGMIVRDYNDMPSNFRYTKTLNELLAENNIPGIHGVDTRKLSRSIRDTGIKKVLITDADTSLDDALEVLKSRDIPHDAVSRVSCKKKWYSRTSNHKFNVVVIDCGTKLSIIKGLNLRGCNVTVVPYTTTADEIRFMQPDGILISNGPGNPEDVPEVIETIKSIKGEYPIFGIGLGHQIISLAYGAKVYKMKFGHHGGNHPIRDLSTNKIEIANQNHSYAVDEDSINATALEITHINVLDKTVEGVQCKADNIFSVQFHPDSTPGQLEGSYLFDRFMDSMKEGQKNA
ncbi:MAG: glutamine-hydrolyzing carbamoyl-phosphate synthase small subunit [Clostridia bacterium]|nr:glutamine-hydrolyzing carbamoyl-phosphate synthase small subunit [Clostridia bacterium]